MEVVFLCCINFLSSYFEQKTLGQMLDSAKALKNYSAFKNRGHLPFSCIRYPGLRNSNMC